MAKTNIFNQITKTLEKSSDEKGWDFIETGKLIKGFDEFFNEFAPILNLDFVISKLIAVDENLVTLLIIPIKISTEAGIFRYNSESINFYDPTSIIKPELKKHLISEKIQVLDRSSQLLLESFANCSELAKRIIKFLKLDIDIHTDYEDMLYTISGKKLTVSVKNLLIAKQTTEFVPKADSNNKINENINKLIDCKVGFYSKIGISIITRENIENYMDYIAERSCITEQLKLQISKKEITPDYSKINSLFGFLLFILGLSVIALIFFMHESWMTFVIPAMIAAFTGILFSYIFMYLKEKNQIGFQKDISKIMVLSPIDLITEPYFNKFSTLFSKFSTPEHIRIFLLEHYIFWSSDYKSMKTNNAKILGNLYKKNKSVFEEMKEKEMNQSSAYIPPNNPVKDNIPYGELYMNIPSHIGIEEIKSCIQRNVKIKDFSKASEYLLLLLRINLYEFLLSNSILEKSTADKSKNLTDLLEKLEKNNCFAMNSNNKILFESLGLWEQIILEKIPISKVKFETFSKITEIFSKVKLHESVDHSDKRGDFNYENSTFHDKKLFENFISGNI